MTQYVAFLKGMNLGKRRVHNEALVEIFEAMGLTEVWAFLASGNVAFRTDDDARDLESSISSSLEEALDYPVDTFVRSRPELETVLSFDFEEAWGPTTGKPQIVFLHDAPKPTAIRKILEHSTEDDRLEIRGRHLLWQPAGKLTESQLDLRAIERLTGPMTVRTRATVV